MRYINAENVASLAVKSHNHYTLNSIPTVPNGDVAGGVFRNGRRTCLPSPSPDISNINLWNILRNNIGKDLSKVAMPVELNEPLNTLQHMCEELEYTELLDKAAETDDTYERMVGSRKHLGKHFSYIKLCIFHLCKTFRPYC